MAVWLATEKWPLSPPPRGRCVVAQPMSRLLPIRLGVLACRSSVNLAKLAFLYLSPYTPIVIGLFGVSYFLSGALSIGFTFVRIFAYGYHEKTA